LLSWSASFVGVLHTALYVLYSACSIRQHTRCTQPAAYVSIDGVLGLQHTSAYVLHSGLRRRGTSVPI
jgi:hypothetical protein